MRPDDWPARLDAYIDTARRVPFAWGSHDCVGFVCGWYTAMTGLHVYAPFAGKYDTEAAALRVMVGRGVHSMAEAGDFLFGASAGKPVEQVHRGDIVLARCAVSRADALGICTGGHAACLMSDGMKFIRSSQFLKAWSV